MAKVYAHIREDLNEIFYIGIELDTRTKYKKRPYCKNRSKFWKNIVDKTNYNIEIIYDNLFNDSAKQFEKFLILLYGRKDKNLGNLVNLTDGGDGANGKITPKEVREKIANSMKGKNKGINNPMYNKNPYEFKNHPNSKEIINIKTKESYFSLRKVSKESGISKTTLLRWLNNEELNKSDYKYNN
jgi:hypothetical protein